MTAGGKKEKNKKKKEKKVPVPPAQEPRVQAKLLNKPAGNRSREEGHPQGWKAQTCREMADEMAW